MCSRRRRWLRFAPRPPRHRPAPRPLLSGPHQLGHAGRLCRLGAALLLPVQSDGHGESAGCGPGGALPAPAHRQPQSALPAPARTPARSRLAACRRRASFCPPPLPAAPRQAAGGYRTKDFAIFGAPFHIWLLIGVILILGSGDKVRRPAPRHQWGALATPSPALTRAVAAFSCRIAASRERALPAARSSVAPAPLRLPPQPTRPSRPAHTPPPRPPPAGLHPPHCLGRVYGHRHHCAPHL
jgi:hypothetical protein